jgi:exportin-1
MSLSMGMSILQLLSLFLLQMLPLTINIRDAYANGRDDEQKFIQNLSLFLCTFLKEHGTLVEKKV